VKLTWDYINRHVTTNMPGYIGDALTKYQHPKPTVPQHSPYKATTIHYGDIEIRKGMYGLPQAGIIANHLLEKRLSEKGYYQCQHTPGLWRHVWQSIVFCLVIDDFGIKVTNMEDMHHLTSALEEHYKVALDWKGSLFCGMKLT